MLNILDKKSANSVDASSVSKISWINEVGSIQGGFETPVSWWNFPIKNVRSCWKKQHLNAMCSSSSLYRVSQNLQDKFLLLWWFLLKAAVLILSAYDRSRAYKFKKLGISIHVLVQEPKPSFIWPFSAISKKDRLKS